MRIAIDYFQGWIWDTPQKRVICNTQGTHYEKALHLFLEHFSCFQLAMENKKKIKLLNDNPSHGTITYGTVPTSITGKPYYTKLHLWSLNQEVTMLSKNVCTYYTYLYLYNPYLFKFLIYWDIVLILLHAYLTLAALLAYHSHWTACTLFCHLPALQ